MASKNGKTKIKSTSQFEYNLKDRVAVAARMTGLAESKIGAVRMQLSALRKLGVLVDLEVRGMSLGVTSATMAEFGIADADERTKRLRGGTKMMIREEYYKELKSCESSYRQLLKRYSYEVTGLLPYRWVPFTAWDQWRTEAGLLEDRLCMIKNKIVSDWEVQLEDYREDSENMAVRAWASIKAQKFDGIAVNSKVYKAQADFTRDMIARALDKFPSKAALRDGIAMDYRTAVVSDMADIEAEQIEAEKLRTARYEIETARDMAQRESAIATESITLKLQAVQQAEYDHRMEQLQAMRSPFDELANEMRARVREAVTGMLESIKASGTLRGKVSEQAANLKGLYSAMAVTGDKDLEALLDNLTTLVGPVGKSRGKSAPEREIEDIRAKMLKIVELTEQEIKAVGMNDRLSMLEL